MPASIHSGYLTKLKKGMRRSHRRWFVLTSAEIRYAAGPDEERASDIIARFPVREIRDLKLGCKEQPNRGFQFEVTVVTFAKGKSKVNVKYELIGESEREEDEWFAQMVVLMFGLYTVETSSLCYVAERFHGRGDMKNAKACYIEAKDSLKKQKKLKSDYAKILNNLAVLEHQASNFELAEAYVSEARDILSAASASRGSSSGKGADTDLARSLNILATLYEAKGKYVAAEPLYREALTIWDNLNATRHVDYATCMSNLGTLLQRMGEYSRAEPLLKKVLSLRSSSVGERHPEYATALNSLANLYWIMGQYQRAEPLYLRALDIRKAQYGENHRSYASSLHNMAGLYLAMREYARAEPLYIKARDVLERELGENHPDYATAVNNIGWLQQATNRLEDAELNFVAALKIRKKVLGKDHPDYAASLNNMGNLYKAKGKPTKAARFYAEEIELLKARLGVHHPDLAAAVNNLANLYKTMGDYAKAEPLYVLALEAMKTTLDDSPARLPPYSACVNNLANLYKIMGDFNRAEPLFRQACVTMKERLGPTHAAYAAAVNNLANLYKTVGDGKRAEPLYREACEILREQLGPTHNHYLTSVNNLAILFDETLGDYASAEQLYLQVIAALRSEAPSENIAGHLRNLANMYMTWGRADNAVPLYEEARELIRSHSGESNGDYGTCLNSLAWSYHLQGKIAQAETLYKESQNIIATHLGDSHPVFVASLINLAYLELQQGRPECALSLMQRASNLSGKLFSLFSVCSERQRAGLLSTLSRAVPVACLMALQANGSEIAAAASQCAFMTVVTHKARSYETVVVPREAMFQRRYPEHAASLDRLVCVGRQLAHVVLTGSDSSASHSLFKEQASLLEDLGEVVEDVRVQQLQSEMSAEAILNLIPVGAALIDYVRCEPASMAVAARGARYLAFIARGGSSAALKFIDLGPAQPIDEAVANWKKTIASRSSTSTDASTSRSQLELELLEPSPATAAAASVGEFMESGGVYAAGLALSKLILWPMLPHCAGTSRLYISPDGHLSGVSFAALPIEQPSSTASVRLLIDEVTVTMMTSCRHLLRCLARTATAVAVEATAPSAFIDPNFDARETSRENPSESANGVAVQLADASIRFKSGVAPLDADSVFSSLNPHNIAIHKGNEAGERLLRQVETPAVLHISTSAFALTPPARKTGSITDCTGVAVAYGAQSPLLRAGLALAGANTAISGGDIPDGVGAGLLTAQQITGLDLLGTELAVLHVSHEAVQDSAAFYGLRCAMALAGARTVVSSLWEIDSRHVSTLLADFYSRLSCGEGRAAALRAAQLQLRRSGADVRTWAGFVCEGDAGTVALPEADVGLEEDGDVAPLRSGGEASLLATVTKRRSSVLVGSLSTSTTKKGGGLELISFDEGDSGLFSSAASPPLKPSKSSSAPSLLGDEPLAMVASPDADGEGKSSLLEELLETPSAGAGNGGVDSLFSPPSETGGDLDWRGKEEGEMGQLPLARGRGHRMSIVGMHSQLPAAYQQQQQQQQQTQMAVAQQSAYTSALNGNFSGMGFAMGWGGAEGGYNAAGSAGGMQLMGTMGADNTFQPALPNMEGYAASSWAGWDPTVAAMQQGMMPFGMGMYHPMQYGMQQNGSILGDIPGAENILAGIENIRQFVEKLALKDPETAIKAFEREGVDVDVIGTLSDGDLADLGLPLGDRRRILSVTAPATIAARRASIAMATQAVDSSSATAAQNPS